MTASAAAAAAVGCQTPIPSCCRSRRSRRCHPVGLWSAARRAWCIDKTVNYGTAALAGCLCACQCMVDIITNEGPSSSSDMPASSGPKRINVVFPRLRKLRTSAQPWLDSMTLQNSRAMLCNSRAMLCKPGHCTACAQKTVNRETKPRHRLRLLMRPLKAALPS